MQESLVEDLCIAGRHARFEVVHYNHIYYM